MILQTIFSLVINHEKPFNDLPPLYFAVMLNTMVNMSRDHDKLRKLKHHIEDKFSKLVFSKISEFSDIQRERVVDFLGAYLSQCAGRDLGQAEPFLLKLTEG